MLNCSYGICGYTLSVVLYCHDEVIGAVSHRLPPLEIGEEAAFI